MTDWIDKMGIIETLKIKNNSLLKAWGGLYCFYSDYRTCLFLQEHRAWIVEGQGWRDSNNSPEGNEQRRVMLNVIHLNDDNNSIWFELFVPVKYGKIDLSTKDKSYLINCESQSLKGEFNSIKMLIFKVMTSNVQTEVDIENNFALLNQE